VILTNAKVRTFDPAVPMADTILVSNGIIAFVGRRADLPAGSDHDVRDLGGATVVPGLIDAHTHPTHVAKSLWHVRLPPVDDVDDLLAFVRDYAAAHPVDEAPYLHFEYYPTTLFSDQAPTAELLDTAVSDRPVLCQDGGDHASWVNSRMLELLGVTAATPDPVPGLETFARDAAGNPTGYVFENAHAHFLETMYQAIGWRPPEDLSAELMAPVLGFWTQHGVTGMFEALIDGDDDLAAIAELDRRGGLNLLYEGAVRFRDRSDLKESIESARRLQTRFGTDHIRVRTLKLFLDGTNELANSAVLEPFLAHDRDGDHGSIQMETDELVDCLLLINDSDLDLHIHMVGDRAFRVACNAVARAQERVGTAWRMQVTFAHCELVDPADMRRPAELGVFVNWTSHWSGGYFGEEARTVLGDERWNRMYDFIPIAESGASLTFSSDVVTDFELHRADPFVGMQVAATRIDPDDPLDASRFPGGVRPSPQSVLDIDVLLRGYTIEAARQLRIEDRAGSLSVGKMANLVVLTADPYDVPAHELSGIRPTATLFEGRTVAGALPEAVAAVH